MTITLPWSTWPWNRCKGSCRSGADVARCDLRRSHLGYHVAERGMFWIWWDSHQTILLAPGRDEHGRVVS